MRIFDCFIFHDELDLLECRVRHLEGIVDQHILVESTQTHQGNAKPLYYRENKERFAPWDITDIGVKIAVTGKDRDSCWQRQGLQRQGLHDALVKAQAEEDDIIIFGDVDEIPGDALIRRDMPLPAAWRMEHRLFAVDWRHPERWPVATVAMRFGDIFDFELLRNSDRNSYPHTFDDGWHFSWLGGPEEIKKKARSWAHTELADMMCEWADQGRLYETGWSTYARDVRTLSVQMEAAGTFGLPQWIQDRKCPGEWFRPETTLTWMKSKS